MNTTWNITKMIRYQSTGLVYEVQYRIISTIEEFTYTDFGVVTIEGNPSSPDFIPYEDLKENIVLEWVKDVLGVSGVDSIENTQYMILQEMINTAQNPSATGLPWER
jgi:hypothetical protein